MIHFLNSLKEDLAHSEFDKRNAANVALLAFDLGRAKNDRERENARKEWEFRMWAFECGYGIKEATVMVKKGRKW